MKRSRSILLIAALLVPPLLHAETVYVIDKLLVGVHSGKTLDSPIIKVFPTGTQLEVLKRDGDLTQVKGPGDVTGWVDASYLTKDQPASVVLDMIETQNRQLVGNLKQAEAKIADLEAQAGKAPAAAGKGDDQSKAALEKLQKDYASLQQSLKAERDKSADLQAKLAAGQQAAKPSDESGLLAQLRHENTALKQALEEASNNAGGAADTDASEQSGGDTSASSITATASRLKQRLQRLGGWATSPISLLIVLVLLLVVSFIAGVALMDFVHRKRHGGFRI